jgi:hypothetical protein
MKKKPTGFIATCQCGKVVGAMNYEHADRKDAGKMLGKWISDGCTIEPRFDGKWSVTVTACECGSDATEDEIETQEIEFPLGSIPPNANPIDVATCLADRHVPDGWKASGETPSIFQDPLDGDYWARTKIHRMVESEVEDVPNQ